MEPPASVPTCSGPKHAAPAAPVEFRLGDGLAPLAGERFDALVSNPPYIRTGERASLDTEVRDWEPASALFAGDDGLEVIRHVVTAAARLLKPGGGTAIEHDDTHARSVPNLLTARRVLTDVRDHKDLGGRPRFATAVRTSLPLGGY